MTIWSGSNTGGGTVWLKTPLKEEYERIFDKMKIQFVNGERAGEIMDFQETEISIGREDGNSIQLLTDGVSRYHAQISKNDDGNWLICDLDSTNGVKIDGINVVGEQILTPGSLLSIGEQQLLVLETGNTAKVNFFSSAKSPDAEFETQLDEPERPSKPTASDKKRPHPISSEKLLADLKSAGNGLFGSREKSSQTTVSQNNSDLTKATPKRSKMLFNVVFYAALIVCVSCVAKIFMDKKEVVTPNHNAAAAHSINDAVVYFERINYDPVAKSAFRFEMKIENGKMTCLLDDIAGCRHFKREIDLIGNYETELEVLLQKLKKSGILQLKPKNISTVNPERDRIHFMLLCDAQLADYQCTSSESGVEFDKCDQAIRDFLNGFGLVTIAQNREELEAEAKNHLRNAKDKQLNYISDLSLLREAAREYEAAISCYEQFTPAPPELKEARTGFNEVNKLRTIKLKECNTEFKRCHRRMDYSGMARACQDIMKIAGEKSKAYREAAEMLRSVKRAMDKKR